MTSVILFDIDGTLFNTKKWIDGYIKQEMNKQFGLKAAAFEAVREAYGQTLAKSTMFNPDDFLQVINHKIQVDPESLKTVLYNPTFFLNALYDDVVPTLEQLVTREFTLGIFSEGNYHFQLNKIKYTELAPYFDPDLLFITDNKIADDFIETLPTDSIVVEDRAEVVTALLSHPRCQPVWLNRTDRDKAAGAQTIYNLMEISSIV